MAFRTQFGVVEPVGRKFVSTVGHVFSAENTEFEHLGRRQLGLKISMKILAKRLGTVINVTRLHRVIYKDSLLTHAVIAAAMRFGHVFLSAASACRQSERRYQPLILLE